MEKCSSVVCGFLSERGVAIRTLPYPPPPLMRFVEERRPALRFESFDPTRLERVPIRTFLRVDHDIYVEEGA